MVLGYITRSGAAPHRRNGTRHAERDRSRQSGPRGPVAARQPWHASEQLRHALSGSPWAGSARRTTPIRAPRSMRGRRWSSTSRARTSTRRLIRRRRSCPPLPGSLPTLPLYAKLSAAHPDVTIGRPRAVADAGSRRPLARQHPARAGARTRDATARPRARHRTRDVTLTSSTRVRPPVPTSRRERSTSTVGSGRGCRAPGRRRHTRPQSPTRARRRSRDTRRRPRAAGSAGSAGRRRRAPGSCRGGGRRCGPRAPWRCRRRRWTARAARAGAGGAACRARTPGSFRRSCVVVRAAPRSPRVPRTTCHGSVKDA